MAAMTLMLGDNSRAPFMGHLRCEVSGRRSTLRAAGRVGVGGGIVRAFAAARTIEAALATVPDGAWGDADRNGLLRRAWAVLGELRPEALGPDGGADLCLVLVASDGTGTGIAGVGLSMVWAGRGERLHALVAPAHPLLVGPGRPDGVPGVLTLDSLPDRVVATPSHLEPVLPPLARLDVACGVR